MSIQIDEDKNDTNDEGNNEENPENNISEEEKLEVSPEEKIEELEDKLLRTIAEMDNMRKDQTKKGLRHIKLERLYSSKICYQ